MASLTQALPGARRPTAWFWGFLKEELAPYPGRAALVGRMVISATLVMILIMTFRIPNGTNGALYALLYSRDSPRATLRSAAATLVVYAAGVAYILISASFFASDPMLRCLWIIGDFIPLFFAVSTITNYNALTPLLFAFATIVPLWGRQTPAEANVEDSLWAVLAVLIGGVVTALVEFAFVRIKPGDDLVVPIAQRLAAVESLLACYIEGCPVDDPTKKRITRLTMIGTSGLRQAVLRSNYSLPYRAQMGAVVAVVRKLVDLAASQTQLSIQPSGGDRERMRSLAAGIASIRGDLIGRRVPASIQFPREDEHPPGVPLLREMEKTVMLIPEAFAGSYSIDEYLPPPGEPARSPLFVPDAFSNPEHLRFALVGCLAAGMCYIIYTSIDWPGLSTSVTTCLLTALSTVGASHQKLALRFAGATVGGFLFGMGSQVFILPYLDSISGFAILFAIVTGVASWFLTSSPRLSYFGLQLALAFYLINLQEFTIQTSLAVARDRVVGVFLGLFMMWLAFDQLWGATAAVGMKRTFIVNLRLLADLTREPLAGDRKRALQRVESMRATINTNFANEHALSDAVLFEFGSSREQDLALRDRIRRWQPQLRTVFLIRLALSKYRFRLAGFDLPEPVELAQQQFDEELAKALDAMADRMEGKPSERAERLEDSFKSLEQTATTGCPDVSPADVQSFLALSRTTESVVASLDKEI
jgi:multidrug resistance protein MdtO